MEKIIEYIDIVQMLNDELFQKFDSPSRFSLSTDGECCDISFDNNILWKSYEDDREFFEDINEYEDLYHFLKKELSTYAKDLSSITI